MAKAYEEVDVADVRVGDLLLCRGYNEKGDYIEEDWEVVSVSTRKYGRGLRYTISFDINGKHATTWYSSRQKFGRRVG